MGEVEKMVNITCERNEQMLELETRVNVLVELLRKEGYINAENLLLILGTAEALEAMEELQRREEERKKKDIEKMLEESED